jgi:restriction endonuclease Mrr
MNDLYIDNLSGNEFEEYLVNLFENLGYNVEHTPASNDYGADLVVSKGSERTVIQAKRYSNTVGISSVQEVIGAKNYYQATKCLVVTNNYFTPNAIELAKCNDVELWDRDILIEKALLSVNPKFNENPSILMDEVKHITLGHYDDELLPQSIQLVVNEQMASISLLQRKLKIGYARAARIIDEMEERGVIGGYEGSKPRKVLLSLDDLSYLGDINSNSNISSSNNYEFENSYKSKRTILNKLLGIAFSLFISLILLLICTSIIENSLLAILSILISIFLSFKIGFLLSDKVFKFNNKYK